MNTILLITISGADHPGVTSEVTGILAEHGVSILDIGQAVIHSTLSMGMLVEIPEVVDAQQVNEAVENCAASQGVSARISPVSSDSYDQWVEAQGSARYIITLLARKITADQMARVTEVGTLRLEAIPREGEERWHIEFDVGE